MARGHGSVYLSRRLNAGYSICIISNDSSGAPANETALLRVASARRLEASLSEEAESAARNDSPVTHYRPGWLTIGLSLGRDQRSPLNSDGREL